MLKLHRFDHLVLTVADIDRTVAFYVRVLGMTEVTFGAGRRALQFGVQKINLHQSGAEYKPHAQVTAAGSGDLCFIAATSLEDAIAHVRACGIDIEEGPVRRTGATGAIESFYIRDPDGNLIEIANYV